MTLAAREKGTGNPIYKDENGKFFVNPGTGTPIGGTRWDYTQGRFVPNNNATGAQFNHTFDASGRRNDFTGSAAANMLMWSQGLFGTPNDPGTNSEEPRTLFPGQTGRLDEFGNYEQTGNIASGPWSGPESYRGFVYGSRNSRARNIPARSFGGGLTSGVGTGGG